VDTLADGHLDGGATTCVSTPAGGRCTLRAAIELNEATGGGSTIALNLPGTGQIQLTAGQLTIAKDVTITGAGIAKNAVTGDGKNRVFAIQSVSAQVAMSGLAVLGGRASTSAGGGILNFGHLTLSSVDVEGNTAAFGGGIADAGSLSLQPGTIVTMNTARLATVNQAPTGGIGGGVAEFGKLAATGAVFSSNSADDSGGNLAVDFASLSREVVTHGSAAVVQTTIAQGTAIFGGGAWVNVGESASFAATTFVNNASRPDEGGGAGGAIENTCGALTLTNDTLDANRADGGFGGAIDQVCESLDVASAAGPAGRRFASHRHVAPTVDLTQAGPVRAAAASTPTPTPAPLAATATLDFVTMADNTAGIVQGESLGSTIADAGDLSTITVHDTIVAKKSGDAGKDCFVFQAKLTSQGYNLESADDCSFHAAGDQRGISPQLGALAGNGGPTQTMALTAGTPAVDTADPLCDVKSDQRGVSRPQGKACDIGAFELQVATPSSPTPLPSPPVTGNGPAQLDLSLVALILALLALPVVGVGLAIARRRNA
jgi:hypothetical protein